MYIRTSVAQPTFCTPLIRGSDDTRRSGRPSSIDPLRLPLARGLDSRPPTSISCAIFSKPVRSTLASRQRKGSSPVVSSHRKSATRSGNGESRSFLPATSLSSSLAIRSISAFAPLNASSLKKGSPAYHAGPPYRSGRPSTMPRFLPWPPSLTVPVVLESDSNRLVPASSSSRPSSLNSTSSA